MLFSFLLCLSFFLSFYCHLSVYHIDLPPIFRSGISLSLFCFSTCLAVSRPLSRLSPCTSEVLALMCFVLVFINVQTQKLVTVGPSCSLNVLVTCCQNNRAYVCEG